MTGMPTISFKVSEEEARLIRTRAGREGVAFGLSVKSLLDVNVLVAWGWSDHVDLDTGIPGAFLVPDPAAAG